MRRNKDVQGASHNEGCELFFLNQNGYGRCDEFNLNLSYGLKQNIWPSGSGL
jgi:hypothetical protein